MFSAFDLCRASLVKRGQVDKSRRRFDTVIHLLIATLRVRRASTRLRMH